MKKNLLWVWYPLWKPDRQFSRGENRLNEAAKGYENLKGDTQNDTRYDHLTAGSRLGENRMDENIKGHDNREGDGPILIPVMENQTASVNEKGMRTWEGDTHDDTRYDNLTGNSHWGVRTGSMRLWKKGMRTWKVWKKSSAGF